MSLPGGLYMTPEQTKSTPLPAISTSQEYLTVFENANIGMYRSSPDGKDIKINPHLLTLTGYTSEKELKTSIQDLNTQWYVDPSRRQTFLSLLRTQERVEGFESEVYGHKTKKRIWVTENAWLVRDQEGNILYYEGTVEDITQRKHYQVFQENLIQCIKDTLEHGLDEQLYQRLLERAVAAIPEAQAGSILVQRDDQYYHFVASVGFDFNALQKISLPPQDLFEFDLSSTQPQVIQHHHTYKNSDSITQQVMETAGRLDNIKTTLCIPVLHNQQRALLFLDNFDNSEAFTVFVQHMANVFAQQIGALLNRLDLENNLNLRQSNLQKWNHFHNNLNLFISETLNYGLDESFYQRLLEHATAVIPGVNAGSIMVRKPDGLYHYVAALGYNLEILQGVTYEENEIVINTSMEPVVVYSLEEFNLQTLDPEKLSILYKSGPVDKIKAMMSLPALIEDKIVATLSLDTFEENGFGPQSLEMAKAFATQLGVLLKRLALEQQLELNNDELNKLANYDSLTGLPNRLLFADRLEQMLGQSRRTGDLVALLYLDLDGFKNVNDSLGHTMGDVLLKAVTSRLINCLREEGTIARLGGDEFSIILHSLKQPQEAAKIAQRILEALSIPFDLKGYEIHIGASLGISLYPDNGYTVEDLLKHGDTAMYQAKQSGKNRYCFFTPELNLQMTEQLMLESDMRHGLERGEFTLHYQPRVHLQSKHIDSVEALLRWKHPRLGFISPVTFIPLAEKIGFILPLTQYVLQEACIQAKVWQAEGKSIRVAVNLSAKCLQHSDILSMLQDVLELHQLDAKYLELEITESAAMTDVENNIKTLNKLKSMGIYISIDDFGTAYSSLNYLKRLPVSSLKIDRSFVKDISLGTLDSPDAAIIKAIVALAKSMGFCVIAEGVETQDQVIFLQFLGCDEAQGYFFCKPLPPHRLFKADTALAAQV